MFIPANNYMYRSPVGVRLDHLSQQICRSPGQELSYNILLTITGFRLINSLQQIDEGYRKEIGFSFKLTHKLQVQELVANK